MKLLKNGVDILFKFIFGKNKFWIEEKNVEFLGYATLDPLGRVFQFESNIYRGVYPNKVTYTKMVLESGLYDELVKKKLIVKTKITRIKSSTFPLILKHEKLTKTIPTEWTFSMYKKAALLILEVNKVCNKYGFELGDAHLYNILFKDNNPIWVDFGSIIPKNEKWIARHEFIDHTVVPLVFLANSELLEAYSWVTSLRFFKIASKGLRDTLLFKNFLKLIHSEKAKDIEFLVDKKWIQENCISENIDNSVWGNYQAEVDNLNSDLEYHPNNRFGRFFEISKIINDSYNDVNSILDLAGNTGLLSLILSKKNNKISKYINTDYDYNSIEKSSLYLEKYKIKKVESYLLNFMLPSHTHAANNFKSDLVFALAVTHHLLLTQSFKIDEVLFKIGSFSKRYVFIEFMPLGMWGGDPNTKPAVPDWYTIQWFEINFRKHFTFIEKRVLESHEINGVMEPHRVLFIGKVR